jgi:hypothetical protein
MAGGARDRARAAARALLGRSYTLSKRVALARMARRREPPLVVFSMGKTGSTAVARAVQDATRRPVYQVFRLDASRLHDAEQRYRTRVAAGGVNDAVRKDGGVAFPGAYHLWESEHLVQHPPTARAPWTVITTVREPVAQAVSAFFHALRQSGGLAAAPTIPALTERFVAENWVRAPVRWFEREFEAPIGIDALAPPFDPDAGYAVVETPAVRLLLLRQESFGGAPNALASFLGLHTPVEVPRRNDGARGAFADIYRRFLSEAILPQEVLDGAYGSRYAQHFYENAEIAQFRRQWSPE